MHYRFRTKTFSVLSDAEPDFGALSGSEQAVDFVRTILRDACDADREHFLVVALNARGRIVGYKIIAAGTLTSVLVHPREVFRAALAFGAASIIVAHSHPSQDAAPSPEDRALTERITAAGELLGTPVVDHLVVASSGAQDCAWSSAA